MRLSIMTDSDIEDKKWVITRIDKAFDLFEKDFEYENHVLEMITEKERKTFDLMAKGIIGSFVIILSLIVSFSSTFANVFNNTIVVADIIIFIIYLAYAWFALYISTLLWRNKVIKKLVNICNTAKLGTNGYYTVKGYYETSTLILENHTVDDYRLLSKYFTYYIAPALNLAKFYALEDSLKWHTRIFFTIHTVNDLKLQLESSKIFLDQASDTYVDQQEKYENNELLKLLMVYGETLLDYKKGQRTISFHFKKISFD